MHKLKEVSYVNTNPIISTQLCWGESWNWKLEGSLLGIAFKIHVIKWRKSCCFEATSSKKEFYWTLYLF